MGVACLPALLVEDCLADGRLVPLLAGYGTEQVPVQVVYPSRRHLPPKVRCFIDLLVEWWQG
ncbi:MAG: hypothetical protein GAK31_00360 [Stenotrophomonas maltophilia]|uniref:LysR substrate-binding domain-containing protein n=1 Tax=Stenotrophomonas maltophilia TaxID=40324 RepID=A0A7V8FJB7_STEMA|nr:MAG: hypothetical protein GAK31_00360 [Stenotrophomonas maltophilia]